MRDRQEAPAHLPGRQGLLAVRRGLPGGQQDKYFYTMCRFLKKSFKFRRAGLPGRVPLPLPVRSRPRPGARRFAVRVRQPGVRQRRLRGGHGLRGAGRRDGETIHRRAEK